MVNAGKDCAVVKAGSSVIEPSALVQAVATCMMTVPLVLPALSTNKFTQGCMAVSQSAGNSKLNCAVCASANCNTPPRLLVPARHATPGAELVGRFHAAPPVAPLQFAAGM